MNKDNLNTICGTVGHNFVKGICTVCYKYKINVGDYVRHNNPDMVIPQRFRGAKRVTRAYSVRDELRIMVRISHKSTVQRFWYEYEVTKVEGYSNE